MVVIQPLLTTNQQIHRNSSKSFPGTSPLSPPRQWPVGSPHANWPDSATPRWPFPGDWEGTDTSAPQDVRNHWGHVPTHHIFCTKIRSSNIDTNSLNSFCKKLQYSSHLISSSLSGFTHCFSPFWGALQVLKTSSTSSLVHFRLHHVAMQSFH